MNTQKNLLQNQISLPKLIFDHFYLGILITLFYVIISPKIIDIGYPGLMVLLLAELVILMPIVFAHLASVSKKLNGDFSFKNIILLKEKLSVKSFVIWTLIGILACTLVYVPFYPVGLFFRENIFSWLPEWYFNPSFGTDNIDLLAKTFLIGIFIDGIIGPVAEELFFRGYLLPRMSHLKNWAPIVNGTFFGLYHFWQPHNMLGIIGIGIILSYIVWKKKMYILVLPYIVH